MPRFAYLSLTCLYIHTWQHLQIEFDETVVRIMNTKCSHKDSPIVYSYCKIAHLTPEELLMRVRRQDPLVAPITEFLSLGDLSMASRAAATVAEGDTAEGQRLLPKREHTKTNAIGDVVAHPSSSSSSLSSSSISPTAADGAAPKRRKIGTSIAARPH